MEDRTLALKTIFDEFDAGKISESQMRDRMKSLGYSNDDITQLIGEMENDVIEESNS